jgi:nitrogen fixation/metabolism regulation signal transduction histidine kinase
LSKKINPKAYNEVALREKISFLNDEQIGKLKYKSAYAPILDKSENVVAFLNLPYFARQTDLQHELSAFIVALINVYVILFALSIAIALFVSNRMVKPLTLLRTKLSQTRLGNMNEPIKWNNNDEIGELIQQYNRMIEQLEDSAEKLAKSEREIAWREMAKQVAHEIKNPLTPMKLSVQQLEKAWKDKAPGWEERFQKFCNNQVTQIETLSAIANEFSRFAQMPKPNPQRVNLAEQLQTVIELYKNDPNYQLVTDFKEIHGLEIVIDPEHLVRILNNLIKNSIQSFEEHQKGLIQINARVKDEFILLSVSDNGTGMTEEVKSRVFSPSFTTKTSGMGLGLAMVRNMITTAGGEITFESEQGKGTTFFMKFPLVNTDRDHA